MIFSLMLQRRGVHVDHVVDINPAKQGGFLPGSGYLVEAPESVVPLMSAGCQVLVMNGNYLDEVRDATGDRFVYRVVDRDS